MKSTIFSLLCLVASVAAGAVDDMLGTIRIAEGLHLNIGIPWHRNVPFGKITTIIFMKNKLDLNPDNIEITADASGLTMKATRMGFVFAGKAIGETLMFKPEYPITITGTIGSFERRYAYGAPLEIDAKDCSIQISEKNAEVEGKFTGKVEEQIKNHVDNLMCTHLYFVGSTITAAVKEMGVDNLKQKSGKGAAGIRAMFGR